MICSNRKTRVFDPSGHETFIAHVSLIYFDAFASYFAEIAAKTQSDGNAGNGQAGNLVRYAYSNLMSLAAHLPTYLPLLLSNDDHSYFVRWKLPTETLEVSDDSKWLRLSSSTTMHLAIVITGLKYLAD